MGETSVPTPDAKQPGTPRSKWPERLWYAGAIVLVVVALSMFGIRRLGRLITGDEITHQVLADLEPVDRIEAEPGALKNFNVLIITTDTTRADHLGCYGNRGIKTPVLDQLARDGILCAEAITPSPSTLPAHSSLLTGLYPYHHGARSNGTFRLEDKVTTLAERLKAEGYRTGAAISAFVLDSRFGLDQGFDHYDDDLTKGMKFSQHMFRERAAELTNEPAIAWLNDNSQGPFFLWIHYFDPHAVCMPPEPFRTDYAEDLYDGEIAYVDSQIGALLSHLETLGVRDKTLVIHTADHGEGLGEHGEFTHSLLVYDATMHIPLIISAPAALPKGKVLERETSLIDVAPTVLSLLGFEVPDELDGLNLCEPTDGKPRALLIETIATMVMHGWAPLVGIRSEDYKYILAPTPELYDLQADRSESKNLHDEAPEQVAQMHNALAEFLGGDPYLAARKAIDIKPESLDSKTLAHLSALGYVATVRDPNEAGAALRDPKEMIVHWETVQQAINLQAQGQGKDAIPILEAGLAEVPGDVFSRSILAGIYREQGDRERALANYQLCIQFDPKNATLHLGMASIHLSKSEFDQAEAKIADALKVEPENAQAYVLRGQIAYFQGRDDEALELYKKAVEMDPGSVGPNAYNQIGFLHMQRGRLEEAREGFQNAIRIDSFNGPAHDGLANILSLEGKVDEAINELLLALRFDPNQPRALATLGSLRSQKGEQDKAEKLCKRAIEISPKYGTAHNNLGLVYRRQDKLDLAEKHYREAIEAEPWLDAPYVNLAQLYMRQGKQDEALDEFRNAIRANPRHPNSIALANLGAYHFNNGRYREALLFYRRALQVNSDYALAHKQIASIYALSQFDRPKLAAFHLRRSLELDPEQPDAEDMRAMLTGAEQAAASRAAETPPEGTEPNAETVLPLGDESPSATDSPAADVSDAPAAATGDTKPTTASESPPSAVTGPDAQTRP